MSLPVHALPQYDSPLTHSLTHPLHTPRMPSSLAGTSHNSYADALPMFSRQTGWLLGWLGLTARLDPVLGVNLSVTAVLQFLR